MRIRLLANELRLEKFRSFIDVTIPIGRKITVISGVNGVGKSNILSLIASGSGMNRKSLLASNFQPEFTDFFNIDTEETYKDYKLYLKYVKDNGEFAIARRLSFKDDTATNRGIRIIPRTTNIYDVGTTNYVVAQRDKSQYNVGGSARVKIPTIYSSLSRLYPLGENVSSVKINKVKKTNLLIQKKANEKFRTWYNAVIPGAINEEADISVVNKLTCSRASLHMDIVNTPTLSQSIGQDNIGNIISALTDLYLLSLEENYHGGLLCIDEIEVSLHPDTQVRMLQLLDQLADDLMIQVVVSTHSLTILKESLKLEEKNCDNYKVVYLKNPCAPMITETKSYTLLKADMFGRLSFNKPQVRMYFEDEVGKVLFEQLMKAFKSIVHTIEDNTSGQTLRNSDISKRAKYDKRILSLKCLLDIEDDLKLIVTHLGCEDLIRIAKADEYFKRVIIMLDGDARIKEHINKPLAKDFMMGEFYNPKDYHVSEREHNDNILFAPNYFAPESYLYRIIMRVCGDPLMHNSFWRGLDASEKTTLYTADKVKTLFVDIGNDFSNNDLKKVFGDRNISSEVWKFILESHIIEYFYSDYNCIGELLDFLSKFKKAYDMTYPLTLSNRYV